MERVFQVVELDKSQIESMFHQHFADKGYLKSFLSFSLGAVNTSYKIIWGTTTYVLRLYVRDSKLAQVEKDVYQLIRKCVPTPNLLYVGSYKELYSFGIFSNSRKKIS